MTSLAHLLAAGVLLAACVSAAPASAPASGAKVRVDLEDLDLDKDDATAETIAVVENSTNDLRVKPVDIPVEIIEDSRPAIKTNEVADDPEEIKRPSIDLRNPGPPQRQEHETQNADYFPNAQEKLLTVQETILQTQNLLRKGIQGVGDDISTWVSNNEQVNTIEQNLQSLRDSFTLQIQKLKEAVKGLTVAPQSLKKEQTPEPVQTQSDLKKVESSIQILENDFNKGVRALSEGVSIVTILRAEDGNAAVADTAPSSSATTPSPITVVQQFFTNWQNTVQQTINNMINTLNIPSNNKPATVKPSVQADTPEGTTPRPASSIWSNFQLPNIFNGQSVAQDEPAGQPQTPGPIQGTFQAVLESGNQFLQTIGLRPPSDPPSSAVVSNPPKPNDEKQPESPEVVVAAAPAVPTTTNIASPAEVAPPAAAAPPPGPIQQILSNNPVAQSIANTVQRIQSSINNPEKPRDTENKEVATKGGYYGGGNRPNVSGGDNNGSSGLKQIMISDKDKEQDVDKNKKPEVEIEKTK